LSSLGPDSKTTRKRLPFFLIHKKQHIYSTYKYNGANKCFKIYDGMVTLLYKKLSWKLMRLFFFSGETKRIATSVDSAVPFPCVHLTQPKEIIYYLCKQRQSFSFWIDPAPRRQCSRTDVHSVLGIQNRGFGTIDERDQANKISATGKPAYKNKISISKNMFHWVSTIHDDDITCMHGLDHVQYC
jgi:hypothetical protein